MINDKVRDIASAVEEQSSTSEEINGVSPTSTTC
jgi:methyl-accepting chemotaxis protein